MSFTELSTGAVALAALIVAIFAFARASRAVDYGIALQKWANEAADPVGKRQIADLAATVTELSDSYDSLLESHKKLRARIGMRAVREKRTNGQDDDLATTRDKVHLRQELRRRGQLP